MSHPQQQNVFIIGAARSGTNMLRDVVSSLEPVITWDCDEINPIWRHPYKHIETDCFKPEWANSKTKYFYHKAFDALRSTKTPIVLEKTCANSLRLGYIFKNFPNAKYLVMLRSGLDVVASAKHRWVAPFDLEYTLKKLRYVTKIYLPFYAARFGWNRLKQLGSKEKKLSFWGPIYEDMRADLQSEKSVEYVAAKQWIESVNITLNDLQAIPLEQKLVFVYEEFVAQPKEALKKIALFLDIPVTDDILTNAVADVRPSSVGKAQKEGVRFDLGDIQSAFELTMSRIHSFKQTQS